MKEIETVEHLAERMLDLSIKFNVWDEHPMIHTLADPMPDSDHPIVKLALLGGDGGPAQMVEALASELEESPFDDLDMIPPTPLRGIVVQAEAWRVLSKTGAEQDQLEAFMREGGNLKAHPQRVEIKQCVAYDGTDYFTFQYPRGGTKERFPKNTAEGALHDALIHLYNAIKGKQG